MACDPPGESPLLSPQVTDSLYSLYQYWYLNDVVAVKATPYLLAPGQSVLQTCTQTVSTVQVVASKLINQYVRSVCG